ncbi:MAG: formyl transferase [Lachnospiraceae bacterium]|nr:formyl transferase [Lachnospiraceae bacterium]
MSETKVLLLSNNEIARKLEYRLKEKGCRVTWFEDRVTPEVIQDLSPDLVVSYNYRHIVKADVIDLLGDRILNLHTSLLPWNRGASPNIWSFLEDTPKGVTIHRLEQGLDTGKILFQKELTFDEETETLSSTYQKLNEAIVDLFLEHWEEIRTGTFSLQDQAGEGSSHRVADLAERLKGQTPDYGMTIREFREWAERIRETS